MGVCSGWLSWWWWWWSGWWLLQCSWWWWWPMAVGHDDHDDHVRVCSQWLLSFWWWRWSLWWRWLSFVILMMITFDQCHCFIGASCIAGSMANGQMDYGEVKYQYHHKSQYQIICTIYISTIMTVISNSIPPLLIESETESWPILFCRNHLSYHITIRCAANALRRLITLSMGL